MGRLIRSHHFRCIGKPEVVTLCGSTKFKKEYQVQTARFTLNGIVVLSVGLFMHADNMALTEEAKVALDWLHKRKIDMSDFIYVINVGGYIGKSTASEIAYAKGQGKAVYYLEACREAEQENQDAS